MDILETLRQILICSVSFCFLPLCLDIAFANSCSRLETHLRSEFAINGRPLPRNSIRDRIKKYHIPGASIAVLNNGKIERSKGYGVKEFGISDPVTTDTLFQAGSVSKPIAALGALYLVDKGLVKLDEDVNLYLKSWKIPENEFTKTNKVTLRLLLSHRAGLTIHGFPGYKRGTPIPTLIEILNGTKPAANTDAVVVNVTPGSTWRYSGGGITVVQLLIEEVTGQSFAKWMKKTILDPIGMHHSTYENPLPDVLHYQAATGFGKDGREVKGKWHVYPEKAAAGLWTTPSDLIKAIIFIAKTYRRDADRIQLISPEIIHEC